MAGIGASFTGPHSSVRDSAAVAGLRSETASERKMRKFLRDPASWAVGDRQAKSRPQRAPCTRAARWSMGAGSADASAGGAVVRTSRTACSPVLWRPPAAERPARSPAAGRSVPRAPQAAVPRRSQGGQWQKFPLERHEICCAMALGICVRGLPGAGEDATHERCAAVTDESISTAAAPCAPTHRGLVGESRRSAVRAGVLEAGLLREGAGSAAERGGLRSSSAETGGSVPRHPPHHLPGGPNLLGGALLPTVPSTAPGTAARGGHRFGLCL